jgi:ubiquinone/menaquinone biosynthesis C-methylase UbiE
MPEADRDGVQYDALADVDTTSDPEPWLSMLRGMWSGVDRGGWGEKEARYADLFRRLGLQPGGVALEVGCGAGGASRLLARVVDGVRVVGVDPSRLAVAEAIRLTHVAALADRVSFEAMDGRQLTYPDVAFDAVFATRVLVHAFDPEEILSEMLRVLRPGGRCLLVEPDRDGILGSLPHDEVDRLYWRHRRSINPSIGRHLYAMCRRAGLGRVEVIPWFRVSTQPPSPSTAAEIRRDLAARSGDYWELVRAGLVDEAALAEHATGIEQAVRSGINLRTDLEFAVLATKPGARGVPRGST